MQSTDVVEIYTLLLEHGVQLWLDGGWGIDALLNQQTRPHKDLDAFVQFADLATLIDALTQHDFQLKQIWEENRWVAHAAPIELIGGADLAGNSVATAFVLQDGNGRAIDLHVLQFDQYGNGIPAWNAEIIFPAEAFTGQGIISGTPVRCLSAQSHMRTHTGYQLLDKDLQDLRALHERFGIAYMPEHAHLFAQANEERAG